MCSSSSRRSCCVVRWLHVQEAVMRRSLSTVLGAALVIGSSSASAQGGDLAGVTMRVLDNLSDVNAVVIELGASRAENEEGADRDNAARGNDANAAAADAARAPEEQTRDEPRARADL